MNDSSLTSDPGSLFQRLQARYGLGQDPLAMDVPYFQGAQRQYALETVRHLAAFGDMALLITGARGAGKTRLLAELVRNESDRLDFHRLSVADVASEKSLADSLLTIAHQGLGAGRSPRDAVYGFFKWSEKATQKGCRIVLLVDDADHAPAAILHLLLAAYCSASRGQAALPVLAGADLLVDTLGNDESAQTQVHQVHLRPLTREEVGDYLRPRIEKAGGDPSALLGSAHLRKLHELSQGSFGRMKRTAPAVWLDIAGHQPAPAKSKTGVQKRILLPVAVAVLLGVSWLVVSWQYDTTVAARSDSADTHPAPERKTVRLGPDVANWEERAEHPATTESGTPTLPSKATEQDVPAPERVSEAKSASDEVKFTAPRGSTEPAQVEKRQTDGVVDQVANADGVESRQPSATEQPAPKVGQAVTNTEEVAPTDADVASAGSLDNEDAVAESGPSLTAPAAESQDAGASKFKPRNPVRFENVEVLRVRPGLTAQFMAGYEEQTALNFLAEYPDLEGMVYTRSTRKGKPWYVVVYGQFSSRDEASKKLQALPGGLARHDVWIRSNSGL